MTEGRMAQIVRKARRLNNLRMDAYGARYFGLRPDYILGQSAPDLSDLIRMLLARVEDVELSSPNNLGDTGQSVKSGRIEYAIMVSREAGSLIVRLYIKLAGLPVRV